MPSQAGRTALVTGANDGLGFLLTRAFASKGARVVMACRNQTKAEAARQEILAAHPGATLDIVLLDLGDLESVRRCAETVTATFPTLDAIMCNAGIMAVPFGVTKDGFELHMGVNYYGHFALVGRLMPVVKRTPGCRVVTTSSVAEKLGRLALDERPVPERYGRWRAYGDSKLAMLMFGLTLDDWFKREGVDAKALSAHPGFSRTSLRTTRLQTDIGLWLRLQLQFYEAISMSAERGVLPLLYAATAPEAAGGQYIGVSGPGEIHGWPKVTRGQDRAYDLALRRQLWEHSEAQTRVRF